MRTVGDQGRQSLSGWRRSDVCSELIREDRRQMRSRVFGCAGDSKTRYRACNREQGRRRRLLNLLRLASRAS